MIEKKFKSVSKTHIKLTVNSLNNLNIHRFRVLNVLFSEKEALSYIKKIFEVIYSLGKLQSKSAVLFSYNREVIRRAHEKKSLNFFFYFIRYMLRTTTAYNYKVNY